VVFHFFVGNLRFYTIWYIFWWEKRSILWLDENYSSLSMFTYSYPVFHLVSYSCLFFYYSISLCVMRSFSLYTLFSVISLRDFHFTKMFWSVEYRFWCFVGNFFIYWSVSAQQFSIFISTVIGFSWYILYNLLISTQKLVYCTAFFPSQFFYCFSVSAAMYLK